MSLAYPERGWCPYGWAMRRASRHLIVIGPTPPPVQGGAFMTAHLLAAVSRSGRLAAHLDTSDPRSVTTTGRFDLRNLSLGLEHAGRLLGLMWRHRGATVYLPLSQVRWGFLRDAVFIWLAALARRRVIVHLHGGSFRGFYAVAGPAMRTLIRATMARVDEAWVLTPAHRGLFGGLLDPERVRVLENTSDDLDPGEEAGERPQSTERFLFLSNLLPEKGLFDLLDALELLGEGGVGIEIVLAGEADEEVRAELEQRLPRIASAGPRVRWAGVLSGAEKAEAFAWAQVFLLPSRYPEGQPISVLEAMSAGLAVIGTDRGTPLAGGMHSSRPGLYADPSGIPETARDGVEGLIVAAGDPQALAAAMLRLIEDPDLRRRLGAAARERYLARYRPQDFESAVARLLGPVTP